jgi:hypothetical protein
VAFGTGFVFIHSYSAFPIFAFGHHNYNILYNVVKEFAKVYNSNIFKIGSFAINYEIQER